MLSIRMALGAQQQELTGMFVRHALLLTSEETSPFERRDEQ
jgi:hypothetical protein